MDVRHTAIEVTDLSATRAFYEDLLGLEHSRDYAARGVQNYYVRGSSPAEIQFRVVDDAPDPAGIEHIAVATDDVDAVVERARREFGAEVLREPTTLERVEKRLAVLTDPDGYAVHVIEEM